ncbi:MULTISPECIES: helix-turn-helix transcriptional regulator [Curtobacterium]|uniref:helix-turn-helix transcriptional regulator n=1 Tax=Curtobacterium TaxID=2034 RepID=UPI0018E55D62|nr:MULTISPECIES: helix-turn-helix transcriptional regulator [Curtobacterium]MCA5922655.1 helix-turn-helix transcriptional regulator [Curtobacterium oceanosedimentum]QQD75647.1 helix-turn-helix transcriptional regulator [Curtobacterium sp. YC1]
MTTERDDARRTAVLLPGERLGLALDERCAEFTELLLAPPLHGIRPDGHDWLRRRYEEIVPLVLPAALRAVEHGEPVDPDCLVRLREVAATSAGDPHVDVSVVLRGALPAIRVFALVMHTATREHATTIDHAGRTMLAMSRASLVAHELGSCWAEAWAQRRERPLEDPAASVAAEDIDLVAHAPGLDETEERMLALAARGLSNDAIAKETAYSRQAVAWHLGRLMRSWNAPNRTALVSVAFVRGWIRSRRAVRLAERPRPAAIEAPPGNGDAP